MSSSGSGGKSSIDDDNSFDDGLDDSGTDSDGGTESGSDDGSDMDDDDEESAIQKYFVAEKTYTGDSSSMPSFPSDGKIRNLGQINQFKVSASSPDDMALEMARYLETSFCVSFYIFLFFIQLCDQ